MLASSDLLAEFSGDFVRNKLETWYTPRQRRTDSQSTTRRPPDQIPHLILQGRDPDMTRIPLNQSYEQSQDVKETLEMNPAEIGRAVRHTNCLDQLGLFT